MALYEYLCEACNHEFDEMLKMDSRHEPTQKPCPSCGENTVILKISAIRIGDPVALGIIKPSSEFKDVMSGIAKKGGPRVKSNLSGKY